MIQKPQIRNDLFYEFSSFESTSVGKLDGGTIQIADTFQMAQANPRTPLEALDASVTLNIDGASSSASIRLPQGTNIDGRCYVEMYTIQGLAGVFRTRSPQIGYGGNSTTIQLEHAINELGDFIIPDKFQKEYTLAQAVKKIFEYYDDKDGTYLWEYGTIETPYDPETKKSNEKCVLDVDYDNCLDALESVMEQYPYMMLSFTYGESPFQLHIRNKPTNVTAEGRLSRNVKSATVIRDDSELFTKVYMDGYKNKNGKYGSASDSASIKKYGLIETTISGASDTATIAERTIKSYLRNHKRPKYNITIDGIELSNLTGESLDKLTIGKMMRLALPDYKTTVKENITGVMFPSIYKNPNAVTITMNDADEKVIKYIKKAQKSASKASKSAGSVAKAAYTDAKVENNILYLTKGDGSTLAFSKAVTLKGSWSDGTYTVRAYQKNLNTTTGKVQETTVGLPNKTTLNSIELQANKSPSVYNTYWFRIPLKVMYDNGLPASQGNKSNTEYAQDVTVNGQAVYSAGWTAARAQVKLPEAGTSSSMTVKVPNAYGSTPKYQQVNYTVSVDANYAYIKLGSIVMARVANNVYPKSGTIYFDSYEFTQGQFKYYYHQTVSQQSQAIIDSGSKLVHYT